MPNLGQYAGILDVVFFLYRTVEDALAGAESGATGFIVSVPSIGWPDQYFHDYAVTNWHAAVRDGFSVMRLNTLDGKCDIFDFGPDEWFWHPNHNPLINRSTRYA